MVGLRSRGLVWLWLILVSLAPALAQTVVSTEVTAMASLERSLAANYQIGFYNLSEGKFTLNSQASPEVKGQLTIDLKVSDMVLLDVTKAWVKAKLGDLRLTVGKTRLSWGEGAMFNAGDVIFNGANADLTAQDLRDNNAWMLALYLPLGDFSFVEGLVEPPDLPIAEYVQYYQLLALKQRNPGLIIPAAPIMRSFDTSSAGIRVYGKIGELKTEAGYLYDGLNGLNKPYVSLQGNVGFDFHLSSSISLPANNAWGDATLPSWSISTGLFYEIPISNEDSGGSETPSSGNLDLRLEAMVKPYGTWTAKTLPTPVFNPMNLTGTSIAYALAVYPEISWRSDTLFAYLRGIWSPVDNSALVSIGFQWAPLQGFKILAGFSCQLGETGDSYGFERDRGWQFTLGTRFNF